MDKQILSFMIKHPELGLSIQRTAYDDGCLTFTLRHLNTDRTITKAVTLFEITNIYSPGSFSRRRAEKTLWRAALLGGD